ncbi:Gfo/Idh/MocA family protein [Microbacterium sp. TNHR37B]|uniref:Gfo/Idh/MocA family protein n=1 Tax=Microbacterium sp. TNHR37B TaxID=1775956 RepID=UPI0007B2B7C8|nr:Gfo/Idh/MocA family oxidoreductase [Microbacterium sp. TNHR37B]KZE88411.1 1,5-anhydro-D-fructose reductase [Microbacterium sp. TNHR37B]
MGDPHGVGIIGLGVISGTYLETLTSHPGIRIVAVADLDHERATAVAAGIAGCRALSVAELLADPEVATVLNLTIPAAHAEIARAAVAAGKNVYGEKPLTAAFADGVDLLAHRGEAWVGAAPDTVLGTGVQTARAVVDSGAIGRPLSAVATWVAPGHELWHPQPDFYYRAGGGPLLDMGPYYVTSLVHLLGPVVSVVGASSRPRTVRTIGSGPRAGEEIPVEVDTHVTGVLAHADGALSTVTFSFDAVATGASPIEVHGELGSVSVPDPNMFDGEVRVSALGTPGWTPIAARAGYADAARGIGLIDFVRGHGRADGALGLHVLEIMTELLAAAADGTRHHLTTTVERPDLVPLKPATEWRTP